MNLTLRHPDAILAPDPARAIRGQIADLIGQYHNPNSLCEAYAVNAAREGRAAYWKKTQYHNALVGLVCEQANLTSLAHALSLWCRDEPRHRRTEVLRDIIALNVKAVDEIGGAKASAYWEEA